MYMHARRQRRQPCNAIPGTTSACEYMWTSNVWINHTCTIHTLKLSARLRYRTNAVWLHSTCVCRRGACGAIRVLLFLLSLYGRKWSCKQRRGRPTFKMCKIGLYCWSRCEFYGLFVHTWLSVYVPACVDGQIDSNVC